MSTQEYPKRLIEVDLPIKRISAHARREKSIRHGHISTLHIWWARRPLAACRAVICAALWPDPADPLCPQAFRDAATHIITEFAGRICGKGKIQTANLLASCSEESLSRWQMLGKSGTMDLNILRFALLDFIADFANWDNSTVPEYLETARALTQAAHEALGGDAGTRPLVVDPFAGGGSIPLEALRVGADAFASDLNPVAVLLNKVMLEYIPKYGQRLADEVRKWGRWIKEQAKKELSKYYPKDPDGSTPIAYLWARTITCEGPDCGIEIPLMRSLCLARRGDESTALQIKSSPKARAVVFDLIDHVRERDIAEGTIKGGSVTCPLCGYTTPSRTVRLQLAKRRGGSSTARLVAVVTIHEGRPGRNYRLPTNQDEKVARNAADECERRKALNLIPDELLPVERPSPNARGLSAVTRIGMTTFADLFTPRQALALSTLSQLVHKVAEGAAASTGEVGVGIAVETCLALVVGRVADRCSSLCRYDPSPTMSGINNTFARQALSITWDFGEGDPSGDRSGGWDLSLEWLLSVLEQETGSICEPGTVQAASATAHPLPDDVAQVFVTDPPYYDAIPYADLSDYFYVWLRRSLLGTHDSLFSDPLTPKDEEAIWNPSRVYSKTGKPKDERFYESQMSKALSEGRRITSPQGIGVVVFAHKSTSGWESLISALISSGWITTASWPIDTEMANRVSAHGQARLGSSVHLVCRPRVESLVGDWRDVLTKLPKRIHDWMPRLASEGVVGADAIFACLGPALEIFSRYAKVEKASGEQVSLKEYLEHVWAAVAKEALSMIFAGADATGFEPDARLTAMWFWTLSTGATANGLPSDDDNSEGESDEDSPSTTVRGSGFILEYDAARKIAQGLGAHLEQLSQLVEIKGDKATLLSVSERAPILFGKDEGKAPAKRAKKKFVQGTLFDEPGEDGVEAIGWGELNAPQARPGATVLDRLHQCMILFGASRTDALKRFLVEEGTGRDARFWKLAQALSALYPGGTEEKRWVDGVLARKKGLGF